MFKDSFSIVLRNSSVQSWQPWHPVETQNRIIGFNWTRSRRLNSASTLAFESKVVAVNEHCRFSGFCSTTSFETQPDKQVSNISKDTRCTRRILSPTADERDVGEGRPVAVWFALLQDSFSGVSVQRFATDRLAFSHFVGFFWRTKSRLAERPNHWECKSQYPHWPYPKVAFWVYEGVFFTWVSDVVRKRG